MVSKKIKSVQVLLVGMEVIAPGLEIINTREREEAGDLFRLVLCDFIKEIIIKQIIERRELC